MILYFDTSALIKLLVVEADSGFAAELWALDEPGASSLLSYAEVRAALATARRANRLSAGQARRAVADCETLMSQLALVGVDEALTRHAGGLAESRDLRGYDAVHLASALAVGEEATMVTWDGNLSRAARAEGCGTAPTL